MKRQQNPYLKVVLFALLILLEGCAKDAYFEPEMDFGSLQAVAVLPFKNLTSDKDAAERVRDTFMSMLLSTGALYVLPAGEVARGIARTGTAPPEEPSSEQIKKLGNVLEVDIVITGVLREYGVVRSGAISANVVSLSLQMIEVSSGRVVWSASSTKGGVTARDRLLGGGGEPMNSVTEQVIHDLLDKLFE